MACSSLNRSTGSFDVLGIGAVAVDDVLLVERYPSADSKAEVVDRRRSCGGQAATALVAAARLGARCAYAGTLGSDELSKFVLECLQRESIDIEHTVVRPGAGPIHSSIVVDSSSGTRNIFFDKHAFIGADRDSPSDALVGASRVLLVDHFSIERTIRVARVAQARNVPIVADFEGGEDDPHFGELLGLVGHLIVSREFAGRLTGLDDPAAAVQALWMTHSLDAAVVTCGADGSWYRDASGEIAHCPAFVVITHDTTGCGDVFHGAYAAALARRVDLNARVRFASAAAALAAAGIGGQESAPDIDMVSTLLMKEV